MRRVLLAVMLFFTLFMMACQSAEIEELLDYHNDYTDNVTKQTEVVAKLNEEIWLSKTDSEAEDLINDLESLLEKMKKHLAKQEPETESTREYHKLRSQAFEAFYKSVKLDILTFRGILDESLSEEKVTQNYSEAAALFDDAQTYQAKADKKIRELSKQYKLTE